MSMDAQQSAPAGSNVGAPTNGPADGTSADAAGHGTSADAAVGTATDAAVGTSADAARDLQLLSAKELWEFWVKCVKLKDEIVDRNQKGRKKAAKAVELRTTLRAGTSSTGAFSPACNRKCAQNSASPSGDERTEGV